MFRNYDPGDPSMRIYIKNLSKHVTEEVWLCILVCKINSVAVYGLQRHYRHNLLLMERTRPPLNVLLFCQLICKTHRWGVDKNDKRF